MPAPPAEETEPEREGSVASSTLPVLYTPPPQPGWIVERDGGHRWPFPHETLAAIEGNGPSWLRARFYYDLAYWLPTPETIVIVVMHDDLLSLKERVQASLN